MEPSPSGSQPPQKAVPRLATMGWRTMLIFNLGLAAFIFAKKRERDIDAGEKMGVKKGSKGAKKSVVNTEVDTKVAEEKNSQVAETVKAKNSETAVLDKEEAKPIPKHDDPLFEFTDAAADELVFHGAAIEPVKVARKPIPEDEQRELFKWILEEKRKVEPKDRKDKRRIDEEKAVLKQFIRAERVPKLLPDDSVDSSLRDWDKFFSSK
ncbi:Transmembrane protein [Hirschfeldia incana]|nr:Transmembrane protein [Hirschfeldia incana]